MSGPGDTSSKRSFSLEPTQFSCAEGHGDDPNNVDLDRSLRPGTENSARSQLTPARKPGDLEGALPSVVDGRQSREGHEPKAGQYAFEESDEAVVPGKSAKTRVTPVESMEGRAEAEGKSAARNALPAQDGSGALTFLQRIGQRARERKEEKFTTLLSHLKVPLLKEAFARLR